MPGTNPPHNRAELAARWRADAQVFRRYGSTGRARMLERLAAELEQSATEEAAAVVDLNTAAQLTGFTRGHLRRLYRAGRLEPVRMDGDEPLFSVPDLPRKLTTNAQEGIASVLHGRFDGGRVSSRAGEPAGRNGAKPRRFRRGCEAKQDSRKTAKTLDARAQPAHQTGPNRASCAAS